MNSEGLSQIIHHLDILKRIPSKKAFLFILFKNTIINQESAFESIQLV